MSKPTINKISDAIDKPIIYLSGLLHLFENVVAYLYPEVQGPSFACQKGERCTTRREKQTVGISPMYWSVHSISYGGKKGSQ